MRSSSSLSLAAISLAFAACSYTASTVPLVGASRDIARLAGDWEGDYLGDETRRRGVITFRIAEQGDSASGDVQMFMPDRQPFLSADRFDQHLQHASAANILDITFVAVKGGKIEGRLEPYRVPDCDCIAYTTFTGTVRGDVITGTFVTAAGHDVQHGKWQVKRKPVRKS